MAQTPKQVSILQKILGYFELAGKLGLEVPEAHVQAISGIVDIISTELATLVPQIQQSSPVVTQTPTPLQSNPIPNIATSTVTIPPVQVTPVAPPAATVQGTIPASTVTLPAVQSSPVASETPDQPAWFKAWLVSQQQN